MRPARTYPDPAAIPAFSLRKALRLIAAGEAKEKTVAGARAAVRRNQCRDAGDVPPDI